MTIREPAESDKDQIRQVYTAAFDEEEKELVADLAIELLDTESSPKTLHLVADTEDEIVGHVSFSPVRIKDSRDCMGYILAPLAVSPRQQKRGVGSALVRRGLEQLAREQAKVVLVYGDPEYYSRFGFSSELAEKYIPPFPLTYTLGWQAVFIGGMIPEMDPVEIQCVEPLRKPELW